MRPYLAIALFALAAFAAACGGGSGSSTPSIPSAALPTNAPLHYARAALSLKIPAQPRTSSIRRPAYVSPNTQSVQIVVQPAATPTASSTMTPQTFPVTTPSPCTQNADGSKTCTFNVQAPIGQDQFTVLTYSVPSPGPNDVPLAVFESGVVNVSVSSTPPPLNFTLTGVVTSVDVTMPSPDPAFTPSTQLAPVGTPITNTLSVTPRDASGAAIVTDTFNAPIMVSLSPANAGVSLSLAGSQCTPASSASGGSASITCAKDLGKLKFTYDGTIARNGSSSVIDHIVFAGSPQASASASPAQLLLTGAVIPYTLPIGSITSASGVRFVKNPDGHTFTYMVEGLSAGGTVIGKFDPANPSAATAVTLPTESFGMTVDNAGNIWIPNWSDMSGVSQYTISCYTGLNTTPASTILIQTPGSPAPITPNVVTTDADGNVWFYGTDPGYTAWAGFIPPGSCSAGGTASALVPVGPFGLGSPQDAQPQKNHGVFLADYSNGLFTADTGGAVNSIGSAGTYSESAAVDSAGNAYVSYGSDGGPTMIASLPAGASSFGTTSLTIPDASTPWNVSVNSVGIPSTFAYGAYNSGNIGIGSAPTLSNVALINFGGTCFATVFDNNGDPWGTCWASGASSSSMVLAHIVRTSVWTAVFPGSVQVPAQGATIPLAILDNGSGGSYTVSVSDPTVASTAPPPTGYERTIPVIFTGTVSSNFTITVTDGQRTQTIPVSLSVAPPALVRRHNISHVRKIPR